VRKENLGRLSVRLQRPLAGALTWSLRDLMALGALAGLTATALALVVGSASTRRSFAIDNGKHAVPDWVAGPLAVHGSPMTAGRFIVLISAMWGFYLLVLAVADAVRVRWAIAALITLTLIFTLAPPLLSTDVFNYIDYARLGVLHHLNPYAHGPIAARSDPVYSLVGWRHTPTIYGPLFTLGSYALAPLGVAAALWSLKVITAIASLACLALVWRCARQLGASPLPPVLFVGLNPILLVYAVGGAHNDVLALLLVLAAMTLALENRAALGAASLIGAVAIKATAGVLIPFMAVGSRRRWAVVGGMVTAGALVAGMGFAVFGVDVLQSLKLIGRHQRLYLDQSVPPHVAVLFGADPRSAAVRRVAEVIALVAVAALLVRTWRRGDWLSGAGWATVAFLLATTWLLPWYTIWLLPLAAVSRDRRLFSAALALGTFVIASRLYFLNL
jgi:alpha-1,6-mannosyltransferase